MDPGGEVIERSGASGPVVGLDLGDVRIGVAATDARRTVATPRTVLTRSGDLGTDDAAIASIVSEIGATLVVVGLPLSLDGGKGLAARHVEAEVERLAASLDVPVVLADERLSTVEATRRRGELGKGRRRRSSSMRSRPVDAEAAAIILQSFIDAEPRS